MPYLAPCLVRILNVGGDSRRPEGAGVLIADRHFMTCAHVVGNVTDDISRDDVFVDFPLMPGNPMFRTRVSHLVPPADDLSFGEPEDICVLKLLPGQALPEAARPARFIESFDFQALQNNTMRMCGFPEGFEDGDYVEGRLMGMTGRGWVQMDGTLTSKAIEGGFSGTAVWDKTSGLAVGTVVGRNIRGGKVSGYMIPVDMLKRAWPAMTESNVRGSLAPFLCDRDTEDQEFKSFFENCCEECPDLPQIYVIPGDEGACHSSLIRRLEAERIGPIIRKKTGKTEKTLLKQINWPFEGPLDVRQTLLSERLFHAFERTYLGPQYEAADFAKLCRRLNLNKHPMLILSHDIEASNWDKAAQSLLDWYLKTFWVGLRGEADLPPFMIFINLIYPSVDTLGQVRWMAWKATKRSRILAAVRKLGKDLETSCRCRIFNELKPITSHHAHQWFARVGIEMIQKEREEGIRKAFEGKTKGRMADIEAWFVKIMKGASRQMSGLHSE